jgi:hypothetical protein
LVCVLNTFSTGLQRKLELEHNDGGTGTLQEAKRKNQYRANNYDVVNSEVFAEICSSQMLELTLNYRAENDLDFAEFFAYFRIIKKGGKPVHMTRIS